MLKYFAMETSPSDEVDLISFAEKIKSQQPSFSRYCLYRADTTEARSDVQLPPHCGMCFNTLAPGNHRVRLAPRLPLTKKLKKLLRSYASMSSSPSMPTSLSRCQKKLVRRYLNSSNVLVISCNVCGKSTKMKCQKRSDRVKQLLAWKPQKVEPSAEESSLQSKTKKKSKKSQGNMQLSNTDLAVDATKQPVVTDLLRADKQKGPIGSPLVASTPLSHQDDGGIGSSQSTKPAPSRRDKDSTQSPVFALLGHQGVSEGGVKKKKKGKHKHQHLQNLLQKQKLTDNAAKSEKKNTLASFLSELSY